MNPTDRFDREARRAAAVSHDSDHCGRTRRGTTALVFAATCVVLTFFMKRSINLYDEGMILTSALQSQTGAIIHRDFYYVYGPATLWIIALLWKLTAYQFIAARLYSVAILAAIVALSYRLMRHLPPIVAWPFTVIVLLALMSLESYLYPVFPCILASLIGAQLLIVATPNSWNWRPYAAGVAAGAAFLFRYDAGVAIGLAQFIWILWLDPHPHRLCRRPRGIRSLLYVAGAATIAGPVLFVGVIAGLSGDFWHDIVISSTTYYRSHRSLPFPGPSALLRHPTGLVVYYPFLAVLTAAISFLATRDQRPSSPENHLASYKGIATLMALMAAIFYYKGLVRVMPLHLVFSVVPAIILMAICAGQLWRRGRMGQLCALLIALGSLAPTLYGSISLVAGAGGFAQIVGGRLIADAVGAGAGEDAVQACVERSSTHLAWVPDSYAVAAGYVRRHSSAADPIFVGLKRHDQIFINDVALYFVAGRLPGTHWAIFDAGLQTQSGIQQAMIADLGRSRVAWIIRNGDYESVHEPNDSNLRDGAALLDRWIAAHFRRVGTTGPLDVWLRNDRSVPADDAAPLRCRLDPVRATVV